MNTIAFIPASTSKDGNEKRTWSSEEERLKSFGKALDEIRTRTEAKIGEEDVRYIKRVDAFSHVMGALGRTLLHFSFEPIGFTVGVLALSVHKILQATEVGHTALHGAFDGLPGAERYASKTFDWKVPIEEESWRSGHNVRHHQYTNVAGKDPDIHFGSVRLTEHTPHRGLIHQLQVPIAFLTTFPVFGIVMNLHFTGVEDALFGNGRGGMDVLPDRSPKTIRAAWKAAFRKFIPYFGKELVFFPLLAGPGFFKVLLGNLLSEFIRDVYTAATIYCGHVGEETAAYPEGTKARGRGAWYAMQVEATNNFEVSRPISMLCGALDRQIEHHLFPRFPTNRIREIAPEVRAVCEAHGVKYRTGSWGSVLRSAFRHIANLARKPGGVREVVREAA